MTPTKYDDSEDSPLKGVHLRDPSDALRERSLMAAREAWQAGSEEEIAWQQPFIQLAACLVVCLGLLAGGHALSGKDIRYQAFPETAPGVTSTSVTSPVSLYGIQLVERQTSLDVESFQERQRLLNQLLESGEPRNG